LGADFRIGLLPGEHKRCARPEQADPDSLFRALEAEPDSLFSPSMAFFGEGEDFNSSYWRSAVIGSAAGMRWRERWRCSGGIRSSPRGNAPRHSWKRVEARSRSSARHTNPVHHGFRAIPAAGA